MVQPIPQPHGGSLTPFQPGQSGNPKGRQKGYKHISTWIEELLNDEKFEANILDSKLGLVEYKGAPVKAIVSVAIQKALNDPKTGQKWADWLAKYGYGSKLQLSSDPDNPINPPVAPTLVDAFIKGLKSDTDKQAKSD